MDDDMDDFKHLMVPYADVLERNGWYISPDGGVPTKAFGSNTTEIMNGDVLPLDGKSILLRHCHSEHAWHAKDHTVLTADNSSWHGGWREPDGTLAQDENILVWPITLKTTRWYAANGRLIFDGVMLSNDGMKHVAKYLDGPNGPDAFVPPKPRPRPQEIARDWAAQTVKSSLHEMMVEHGYRIVDDRDG